MCIQCGERLFSLDGAAGVCLPCPEGAECNAATDGTGGREAMLVLLAGYFHSAPLSANILVGPPSGSILLTAVWAGGWHTVMRSGHDCVRARFGCCASHTGCMQSYTCMLSFARVVQRPAGQSRELKGWLTLTELG